MDMYIHNRRILLPDHMQYWKVLIELLTKKCENGDFGIVAHTYYPNPAGLGHSKSQEKYVLITGNDILTPHIWYLTQRKVQGLILRWVGNLCAESD